MSTLSLTNVDANTSTIEASQQWKKINRLKQLYSFITGKPIKTSAIFKDGYTEPLDLFVMFCKDCQKPVCAKQQGFENRISCPDCETKRIAQFIK
jgi:hypothetical protein